MEISNDMNLVIGANTTGMTIVISKSYVLNQINKQEKALLKTNNRKEGK